MWMWRFSAYVAFCMLISSSWRGDYGPLSAVHDHCKGPPPIEWPTKQVLRYASTRLLVHGSYCRSTNRTGLVLDGMQCDKLLATTTGLRGDTPLQAPVRSEVAVARQPKSQGTHRDAHTFYSTRSCTAPPHVRLTAHPCHRPSPSTQIHSTFYKANMKPG